MATNTTKISKSDYPVDELDISKAIQYGENLLESASLPVVMGGDVAEQIVNHKKLNAKEIEFLVKKSDLSEYAISTLNSAMHKLHKETPEKVDRNKLDKRWKDGVMHEGILIKFNIVKQDKGFLKRPDQAYFWGGMIKVPNPFEKYWRMRGLVV